MDSCVDCGFCGFYVDLGRGLLWHEMDRATRKAFRFDETHNPPGQNPGTAHWNYVRCSKYLKEWGIWDESAPSNDVLKDTLLKKRDCSSFTLHEPGLTPQQHLSLNKSNPSDKQEELQHDVFLSHSGEGSIIEQCQPGAKSTTDTTQPIIVPKDSFTVAESKLPFGKNMIFAHRLLGPTEIKYLSLGDLERIGEFLQEADYRHFAALIVHNQLVQPKISLKETEEWPNEVLIDISSKLLENEPTIKDHFQRRTEHNFFEDFHQAFVKDENERRERLGIFAKGLQVQVEQAMERLTSVVNIPGFKAVMQVLSTYDFRGLSADIQAIQNMSRFAQPPVAFPRIRSSWLDAPLMEPTKYHIPRAVEESEKETIEVLLGNLEPELERKRQGSWQTFQGKSQDRLSQAMSSMREVLRQLLDILAPEEDIPKAPWYSKPRQGGNAITRKMRVRYALAGNSPNVSQSTLKLIESLASSVDETYHVLSAESHRLDESLDAQVEAHLKLSEAVILTLLVNRNV